jgi:uncharacterized membrane protein YraQ (UPF0718 family)
MWFNTFLLVFTSLVVQALPFVIIGAVVSAAIEVFLGGRLLQRLGSLPTRVQLPAAALAGAAFPLCECGSVPVARRLAAKGLPGGAAVAFMLAAPVINPIVLVSTAIAYRGHSVVWAMVAGRFVGGVTIAVIAGWVLSGRGRERLLRDTATDHHDHEEPHDEARPSRGADYVRHFADDAVFMTRFLVIGAAAAAALQSILPQSVLRDVGSVPGLDILAMMALAALLSLCSESDAFVAASFVQFNPASQLAFLLVGPMWNIKLSALYAGTFRRGFVRTVAVVVGVVVFAVALWLEVFLK